MNKSTDKIKELIQQLTLEEKAALCAGSSNWDTTPVERLGIPSVMLADGPHGLRKQYSVTEDPKAYSETITSVCFPCGAALAATFDRTLIHQLGETIGEECQAENVAVILGPGANIKRSPLCGRNFEYYSEDPLLSSEIAAAFIQGVQSKNIGVSLKHFTMNNQETRRLSVDARADERTMREIYLASFENAVRKGKPWTVMTAYNKINGVYGSENQKTITGVLRNEWGFDGLTMTDWGGVNDRVAGMRAGLDLEMPYSSPYNEQKLVDAVRKGELDETCLDQAVERLLTLVFRFTDNRDPEAVFDREAHHQVAREIASNAVILLKNEGNILPLDPTQKIAFIGSYAASPRFQGSGSSFIKASRVTNALDASAQFSKITYAKGFEDETDQTDPVLFKEALSLAENVDIAVIFAGLPDTFESEGYDRTHLRIPTCQSDLIKAVAKVNPNTIVVLHNGAPIEMPWVNQVQAILETYLSGEAVGEVTADILFGNINPSGKIAETFPQKLEDTPAYLTYPGEGDISDYTEGIYVGYRYYDSKRMPVLFPFGHGLSYTSFVYSDLVLSKKEISADDTLEVSFKVTNTGNRMGKEAAQIYIHSAHTGKLRPEQELKAFGKVALEPVETKTITCSLEPRAFAAYETLISDWNVENGAYEVRVGSSSRDIRLSAIVRINNGKLLPVKITSDTILKDILSLPGADKILGLFMEKARAELLANNQNDQLGAGTVAMFDNTLQSLPLHSIRTWVREGLTDEALDDLIGRLKSLDGAL